MVVQVDMVWSTHHVKGYSGILEWWFFCDVSYHYFDSTIHPTGNCWTSTVEKVAQVALNRFVLLIVIFPSSGNASEGSSRGCNNGIGGWQFPALCGTLTGVHMSVYGSEL